MFGWDSREASPPAMDMDAYLAFLLEHTGLPRHIIQQVLDANDLFWEQKVAQMGFEGTMRWAQGESSDDDLEPDGA